MEKKKSSTFHEPCSLFRKTDAKAETSAEKERGEDPPGQKDSRMLSPWQVKRAAGDFQKQHGALTESIIKERSAIIFGKSSYNV
ncbi:MAG: hypothetical protein EA344_10875 [Alkalicoccus sp.]|nr:MAG: hypothetical protein EA344_10875 [Alkalicoccus sp.]